MKEMDQNTSQIYWASLAKANITVIIAYIELVFYANTPQHT